MIVRRAQTPINHDVFQHNNIDIVVRMCGPVGFQPIIRDINGRILYRGDYCAEHLDAYNAAVRAWELGETPEILNRRETLDLETPPTANAPETRPWHCSKCDDDQPHFILQVDGDGSSVKTQCAACNRETWR